MSAGQNRRQRTGTVAATIAVAVNLFSQATAASGAQPPAVAAFAPIGVFNSLEFTTNATQGLGNWKRALKQLDKEAKANALCDAGDAACPKALKSWRKELAGWRGLSPSEQLIRVNDYANAAIVYVEDKQAFGKADYWATPAQSLKGRGDCEDYALLKYASLRSLGFAEADMRLVVLNDLKRGLGHAVLSVKLGADTFILDNQDARILRHDTITHYAPVYSINAQGRWVNIAVKDVRRTKVAAVQLKAAKHVEQRFRQQATAMAAKLTAPTKQLAYAPPKPTRVLVAKLVESGKEE
jgi:predicted transglutaminase-like cysteine proteinase